MSIFDEKLDDIITVRDEKNWEPHEQCRVRTVVKVSDTEWVNNQLVKITQGNRSQRRGAFRQEAQMDIQAQTAAANRLWVYRMLKDWTFTRGGQPMPLTLEALRQLPQSALDFIYEAIEEAQPKDEEEEEQDQDGDDQGDEKEEGSAFFGNVSVSTDGDMSDLDEEENQRLIIQELMKPTLTKKSNRNHLSR